MSMFEQSFDGSDTVCVHEGGYHDYLKTELFSIYIPDFVTEEQ